ncbi:putative isomerase YddE [Planctomycetes bacterium Pla163]|uniref:Putative isomerase YddE n=1 Tax=Rohdeia mirabilis TaxID=2528008 RepID=A0A518D529_9BACT|nr:putative isomerase YddE [Planctomycetes bacterium Pla163]
MQLFQVDAFAERPFEGNPAAVVPLERWLDDGLMQRIALENNLSETAFIVRTSAAPSEWVYELRWFTPVAEVDLCGHATLASGFVAFTELGAPGESVRFTTRAAGELVVGRRQHDRYTLDLPRVASDQVATPAGLADALGAEPLEVRMGRAPVEDLIAVFTDAEAVRALRPDFGALARLDARGVIATAAGDDAAAPDFVSRFFGPAVGVDEDPFTGSAHSLLGDLWSVRLGRTTLAARQLSVRGGSALVEVAAERVTLVGGAVLFLRGEIVADR